MEDVETFLTESGFKLSEEENGIQIKLTKTIGNKTVEVVFEARYDLLFISILVVILILYNIDNLCLMMNKQIKNKNKVKTRIKNSKRSNQVKTIVTLLFTFLTQREKV